MIRSESIKEIVPALVKAQQAIEPVVKDKIAKGTKFNFAYADLSDVLAAVMEPLNANGIVLLQTTIDCKEGFAIETMLCHTSGEFVGSLTPLMVEGNDPQSFGSAMTYAKRYGLSALLGIATEDDDAKAAMPKNKSVRLPNDKEQHVIDKVYEKLLDSAPEGKQVSKQKIAGFILATKGKYVDDINLAGTIASYILSENKINAVCIDIIK